MNLSKNWMWAALALMPALALAQSPYKISGLHTELVFTEAVAMAEKLGGTCRGITPLTTVGGKSAQCDYLPCIEQSAAGVCNKWDMNDPGLTIGAQPIMRIGLEAPADDALVTRIVILYEGSPAAVAETLKREFGQPASDGTTNKEKSWSHSRRLSWNQGEYRMGLLDTPKMVILAANRAPPARDPDDT